MAIIKDFEELNIPELWGNGDEYYWVVWGQDGMGCLCDDGKFHSGGMVDMARYDTLIDAYIVSDQYYDKHGQYYHYVYREGVMYDRFGAAIAREWDRTTPRPKKLQLVESKVMEF